jgi:hypothetical protein
MYGYQSDENLTIEELFSIINQEKVFNHVLGDFNTDTYITSPFRQDDSPGCWVQWRDDRLYFTDFANTYGKVNLDAVGLIQQKYNLKLKDAISFIYDNFYEKDFHDKLLNIKNDINSKSSSSIVTSSKSDIEFCPKPFDEYHKKYWSQYEISSANLIEDNVFATKWYKVKGSIFTPFPQETTYTIRFHDGSVKICKPKATEFKWMTNATKNTIGGSLSFPIFGTEYLIISKSYKDWRVLTNLGYTSIYFQNEGMFPNMEILYYYLQMSKNVIVLFDNDETGKKASLKLVEYINNSYPFKATSLILPTEEKDPADIIKAGKKSLLINFLTF